MIVIDNEVEWSQWMRASIAGDASAYDKLLRCVAATYRRKIRAALARASASGTEAEDVLQEFLIAVHTRRWTWDPERPLVPWLSAIARHKVIDAINRAGRRKEMPIDVFADELEAETPDVAVLEVEIERKLKTLPSRQREVVEIIAIRGGTIGEAASALDMSEGAIRVAFHRALKSLSRTEAEK